LLASKRIELVREHINLLVKIAPNALKLISTQSGQMLKLLASTTEYSKDLRGRIKSHIEEQPSHQQASLLCSN